MSELVIRTRALRKRYGERDVVDGVDLEVRAGEIFAFLGPNSGSSPRAS